MVVKLASLPPILDHYDDGGRLFLAEVAGNPVPDMVKQAVDMSTVPLYENDYALVVQTEGGRLGKFPIADAGNALASAVYYEKTAFELPTFVRKSAATKLVEALEEYGIPVPPYLLSDLNLPMEKEASLEDVFANMVGHPGRTLEEMFEAGSPMDRREAALTLVQNGTEMPPKLAHYAAHVMGSDVAYGIDCRIRHLAAEYRGPLEQLKKVAHLNPPDEVAAMLSDLDQETGLTMRYGVDVPDPFETVFGQQVKRASLHKRASLEIGGRALAADRIEAFLQSRPDAVVQAFGDDVANQLAERPIEVLTSLPEPHQLAIARMI